MNRSRLARVWRGPHYAENCSEMFMLRQRLLPNFRRIFAGLCFWLLISVLPALAFANVPITPVPVQLTVADGLPSNTINDFAEDKYGYLWLASADGLARFDGRSYRIWRMEEGLTDNFVWAVSVDSNDGVWVGFENGGAGLLDAKKRAFKPLEDSRFPEFTRSSVWAIAHTPDHDTWFGTSKHGLYRLRPDGTIEHFKFVEEDDHSLPGNSVTALRVTPDGALWVGGNSGVARWTGSNFKRVLLPGDIQSSNGMRLDSSGNLWVTNGNNHLYRLDSSGNFKAQPWQESKGKNQVIGMLLRDRAGRYWLDTMSGLGKV